MNKKVKNAKHHCFNGIEFKSQLEVDIYKGLLQAGYKPLYEQCKYCIFEGFKPTVPFYTRKSKKLNEIALKMQRIKNSTYTPDFVFIAKDKKTVVVIEAKGFMNDVYPIKRKLFRAYLENAKTELNQQIVYFEIYTKKQLLDTIEILEKDYGTGENQAGSKEPQP